MLCALIIRLHTLKSYGSRIILLTFATISCAIPRLARAARCTAQSMNNATHDGVDCLASLKPLAENLDTGDEGHKRPFDKLLNKPFHHGNERPLPVADAT